MRRGQQKRGGFTLLEILVALAISGLLMVSAYSLSIMLSEYANSTSQITEAMDRDANGDRLLRRLALSVESGADTGSYFGGNENAVSFSTWCDTPRGWTERCDVTLGFDSSRASFSLYLARSGHVPVVLRSGFDRGEFRYLRSADDGGQWFRVWGRGVTIPLAIGVIIDGDTAIVRMGERG